MRLSPLKGMLENMGINTLNSQAFLNHHAMLKFGMMVSAVGFVLVIVIAVYKPWMRKRIQAM